MFLCLEPVGEASEVVHEIVPSCGPQQAQLVSRAECVTSGSVTAVRMHTHCFSAGSWEEQSEDLQVGERVGEEACGDVV